MGRKKIELSNITVIGVALLADISMAVVLAESAKSKLNPTLSDA